MNLLPGEIGADGRTFRSGALSLALPGPPHPSKGSCILGLRPESLRLTAPEKAPLAGKVGLAFDPETLVFFDGDTNRRIDPVGRPL
jgi:hypothetical protein